MAYIFRSYQRIFFSLTPKCLSVFFLNLDVDCLRRKCWPHRGTLSVLATDGCWVLAETVCCLTKILSREEKGKWNMFCQYLGILDAWFAVFCLWHHKLCWTTKTCPILFHWQVQQVILWNLILFRQCYWYFCFCFSYSLLLTPTASSNCSPCGMKTSQAYGNNL